MYSNRSYTQMEDFWMRESNRKVIPVTPINFLRAWIGSRVRRYHPIVEIYIRTGQVSPPQIKWIIKEILKQHPWKHTEYQEVDIPHKQTLFGYRKKIICVDYTCTLSLRERNGEYIFQSDAGAHQLHILQLRAFEKWVEHLVKKVASAHVEVPIISVEEVRGRVIFDRYIKTIQLQAA